MENTPTSLGRKRKAPPPAIKDDVDEGQQQQQLTFAFIPDACWQLVSSFASPPDVYNLSLSSKHFFRPIGTTNDVGDEDDVAIVEDRKPSVSAAAIVDIIDPKEAKKAALQAVINSALENNNGSDVAINLDIYKAARNHGYSKPFILHSVLNALPANFNCNHEAVEAAVARGEAALPSSAGAATSSATATTTTTPNTLLATSLLRQSLLSSLSRVLDNTKSGITLDAVLDNMPDGALIAGSTIAQACLGVLWGGEGRDEDDDDEEEAVDVDIFCSAKSAPMVRSWLVEKANAMFGGFHDTYIDIADNRLLYTVDTKIHHVEKWGSIFENMNENLEGIDSLSRGRYGDKTVGEANREKEGSGAEMIDVDTLKKTEYYRDAIDWGKNCQKMYVDWKWKHGMCFDQLGVDRNKAYNIKPKPNGDLPFDFNGDGSIDLIVSRIKAKGSRKELTAFDLLEDFDLTICKASFDGKKFRIPDPHRTFSAQSTMEPNRRAIVESYVRHFTPPSTRLSPMAASALASATIKKVRKDVSNNVSFFRHVDLAARLPEAREDPLFGFINFHSPMVQAKIGPPIQFHNWTCKLIRRLRKYQQRGIEVVGAPTIGEEEFPEFSACSHGG